MTLMDIIEKYEGFSGVSYKDHLGYDTIGFGTKLPISKEEAMLLAKLRLDAKIMKLHRRLHWLKDQPDEVQEILYEMAYQMGVTGLLKFKKTIAFIEDEEYFLASSEMLHSVWAEQTPERANRLAERMRGV